MAVPQESHVACLSYYAAQPYEMCMKAVYSQTMCAKKMRKKKATLGEVLQQRRAGSVHPI